MVEGKAHPNELGPPEFNINLGKTIGLLLRMTKSIWNSGHVIILNSGFCVLKGIVELGKKGLYAGALIKKRRYWPKFVKGDIIKEHFVEKHVGDVDAWQGKMDDQPLYIFAMKEPDYIMSIIANYGTTNEMEMGATKRHYT